MCRRSALCPGCGPASIQSAAPLAAGSAPAICSIHCSPPRSGTDRQAIRVVKAATPKAVISGAIAVVHRAVAVAVNRRAVAVDAGTIAIPILCTRRCGRNVNRQHGNQQTCHASGGEGTFHDLLFLAWLGLDDVVGW